ncbi:glycerophosphocholine phosphodiesterase GPCPD1 isoform X1 [Hermetia illucens]|nr:glycerophosphocholine phosphodiesterase GPCPD1 isoform X1 [Hermetia illucens]XP_037906612.1 glycerophosphocholine phosphodiesterase GPCPD1 isoform X1 [Hermetia illucens]
MQRWFFMDDNEILESDASSAASSRSKKTLESSGEEREWTFKVVMNHDLLPNECLGISGSCASLGNWSLTKSVLLNHEEGTNDWSLTTNIPRDRQVYYRFFVCSIDPTTESKHVRRWETHLHPRSIPEMGDKAESDDIFGDVEGEEKIDRGWLTTESIVQLKFFNSPFALKQRMKSRLLYIKVTPMNLRIHTSDNVISPLEDSLSNDTRENGSEQAPYGFAEVCCYKYDDCDIKPQPQFGVPCAPNDVVVFHITVGDIDSVAYLVDLYTYSSKASMEEPPYHLGYHYILPNLLKRSEGKLEMPITCATKHRPLGTMRLDYLLIKPFTSHVLDMKLSFSRYWNKKWSGLDVGHRGSGTSFKTKEAVIRENTIASLKNAVAHGADMVEFDVQLSKDLVPVIYHDFHVYVSLRSKKTIDTHDLLELPMRELTLEQLKNLKVYHLVEGRTREPRNFDNDSMEEHQPFPTLADTLDAIDSHVGFNIEIKWSQQLIDGSMEMEQNVDRNLYLDCILDVVFSKANSRRIVFSCFDPDICAMLRFKQNLYPVMFLTLGQTSRYPLYNDPRCNSIEKAACHSRGMELLGIVAHTEDLLRDPTQVSLTRELGLIMFCWGDDNNSRETIQHLKNLGLHAIIYDKMEVLTSKETKESVFLVPSQASQKDFFKLQALERERRPTEDCIYVKENSEKILELDEDRRKISLSAATSFATLMDE